jgi:hypothetical protein
MRRERGRFGDRGPRPCQEHEGHDPQNRSAHGMILWEEGGRVNAM